MNKKTTIKVSEIAIRKKMLDLDIKTINELSEKSGVSKPTIYGYFNGQSPISTAFIKLCNFLESVPEEMLVTEVQEEEENNV